MLNQKPLRRIVLFLDGTWNDDSGKSLPTNIVRMHEALKIGVDEKHQSAKNSDASASGSLVAKAGHRDVEYVVHYDTGVGTGFADGFKGGALGIGLDDNIRQAYRFLSKYYRTDDEIHIFGFSRGAFTARSIVGYLFSAGLLKEAECTTEREEQAWNFYRTHPDKRNSGDWHKLQSHMHPSGKLKIKSVGVFDTVGALGVPLSLFRRLNATKYAFHNTELCSIVEFSFHAAAIDEHRPTFEATLWRKPKFKEYPNAVVEQVWFPGAHADIGGGYSDWSGGNRGREDIAYTWMVRRLIDQVGLDFAEPKGTGSAEQSNPSLAVATADIHRPWGKLDTIRQQACRAISQIAPRKSKGVPVAGRGMRVVGLSRHEEEIGEKIHVSALVLLADKTGVAWEKLDGKHLYRPPNLLAVLPLVASTYRAWNIAAWATWEPLAAVLADNSGKLRKIEVVDWDGTAVPLAPPQGGAAPNATDVFGFLGADPKRFGF